MKRLLIALAGTLLWTGSAAAQTCLGSLPFQSAPLQAGGNVGFSSNTHTFAGLVAKGTDAYFLRAGAVFGGITDFDGGLTGVLVQVGTERKMGAGGKYFVCPSAGLLKMWGPNPSPDFSSSSLDLSLGGSVGFEASRSGNTRIVPTVGFHLNIYRSSFSGDFLGEDVGYSTTDNFGTLEAGVGLIFSETKAFVPSIIVPVGHDEGEVVFSALFVVKLK